MFYQRAIFELLAQLLNQSCAVLLDVGPLEQLFREDMLLALQDVVELLAEAAFANLCVQLSKTSSLQHILDLCFRHIVMLCALQSNSVPDRLNFFACQVFDFDFELETFAVFVFNMLR